MNNMFSLIMNWGGRASFPLYSWSRYVPCMFFSVWKIKGYYLSFDILSAGYGKAGFFYLGGVNYWVLLVAVGYETIKC